jgi:hypothetical protein
VIVFYTTPVDATADAQMSSTSTGVGTAHWSEYWEPEDYRLTFSVAPTMPPSTFL